ncbi:MAG: hypothetical protein DMD91_22905 [Candidatus Rokuibacteriota bacterium]|nr:MAG: hypothetical protein DMD91_22905 [Candidatus Rokubacteria bacterium]
MKAHAACAALVLVAATVLAGCASGQSYVGQVSHEAGRSAVEGITEGVSSAPGPIRQAMRETLLGDDTLTLLSQRMAQATVEGMRRGLSEEETQQLIDGMVQRTIAMIGSQSGETTRQLIETIEPELSLAVRRSMTEISGTFGENLDRDLTPRTREMARAIADVIVKALATGLEVQLDHIRETARAIGREMISEAALSMKEQKEFVGEITQVAMRQGMRGGLSEEETQQLIDGMVQRTIAMIGSQSGETTRQLIETIEPELSLAVRRSMTEISGTFGENLDRDLTPRTREMARAIADVIVKALATGLEVQLDHIRETARAIGREMISEAALSMKEQKEFVGEITQVAIRQGMRGAIEGARDILPGGIPRDLLLAMIALGVFTLLSGGGLLVYWWRYRQSTKSLTIIARQLNDFEAGDLKEAIHKSADDHYVGKWLSNFLTRRGL